jgi:hypothetical protein
MLSYGMLSNVKMKKQRKDIVGWTDNTLEVSVGALGTLRRGWNQQAPSDEPTIHFVDVLDEFQRRSIEVRSVRWTDGPLEGNKTETRQIWSSSTRWTDARAAVHPTVSKKLTVRFWPWSLQHWINRRCVRWSVGAIVSSVMCSGEQQLVAPDELTPGKTKCRIIRWYYFL